MPTLSPDTIAAAGSSSTVRVEAKHTKPDVGYAKSSANSIWKKPGTITCDTYDNLEMIERVNIERSKRGLKPYGFLESLNRVAAYHSWDQAIHNRMTHTDSRGRRLRDRVNDAGCTEFKETMENVSWGRPSIAMAIKKWMDSPKHRANILHPRITHFGAALWFSKNGVPHYTQSFAEMRNAHPVFPMRPTSVPGSAKTCGTVQDTPRPGPPERGGEAEQPQLAHDGGTVPEEKKAPKPKSIYKPQPKKESKFKLKTKAKPKPKPQSKLQRTQPSAEHKAGYSSISPPSSPKKVHKAAPPSSPKKVRKESPPSSFKRVYKATAGSDLAKRYCKNSKRAPGNARVTITITKRGRLNYYHCKWTWTVSG
ncbi:hypothetical protein BJ684DRAFT_20133 [Piptocephalis cylindrospora]|uniref:SCP domain-containing protein n=1 Tax=Piptocephalis cylindrospora TaxID=1907219 RepID=A0A4P9Y3U4_9FUNG|nr:hypothetical protein BJ684DRAFT_20133 [Piptocephalis cylindrospora]|eukprot:RKP13374.1 hypothetical protein BJ684DRAFT_20133 [Piptocephalis cylindrospora]